MRALRRGEVWSAPGWQERDGVKGQCVVVGSGGTPGRETLRVRAGGGLVRASSRPLTQWARPGKEGTGEDRQAERRHKEQNPRWGQITGCVWTRVEMVAQEVRVRDRISRISEESPL